MLKIILIITGSILLVLGGISMVTPLPGATLMFAIGLTLLICTSQKAANAVKQLRRKVGFIDKGMAWMEMKMGPKVGDALKRTNPNFPPKPD